MLMRLEKVLNLIINGLPSIYKMKNIVTTTSSEVLNLIINGLPSILKQKEDDEFESIATGFKPYYKWITFNMMMNA